MSIFKSHKTKADKNYANVIEGLKNLYNSKLLPLEKTYRFHEFHSPQLEDGDFDAKPMVMLLGQYSTGKTTFIRYILEEDFPGMRIGPEPTTDSFVALMEGDKSGMIPGNALVVDTKRQFRPLSKFGNNFLNRFQCATLNNPVLKTISFIDTPGILSGEKQRLDRGYNFGQVIEWFAERVDRIILLFDAHKLDISDEFKRVIELLKGYEDKIRIVLNKADRIDSQQLMRVYGALMWSLGKVLYTPEVTRVYIGSFWDQTLHYDTNRKLFELEEHDLMSDLQSLPCNAALRKLNDLIRRARLAKVHAYIISSLKNQMPAILGKDSKKKELISNLQRTYDQISKEHSISIGDFPKIDRMQEVLQDCDFKTFSVLKTKLIEDVDSMLANDVAKLMQMIPKEQSDESGQFEHRVKGGAFEVQEDNLFGVGASDGINKGKFDDDWVVGRKRYEYDEIFKSLNPSNGKLNGTVAKEYMVKTKLPYNILGKIWKLADVDLDGFLDIDEFALASYLLELKLEGEEIPNTLPDHLMPPSKRVTTNGGDENRE